MGGGENSSRFSKNNSLQIGTLKWNNVSIWENKNSGPKTDGKFGLELFENKVIEINFDKNIIVLHPKLPNKVKKYEKLKLIFEDEMMFVEATCEIDKDVLANKFLIHSGYSGTILLDDKFVNDYKIDERLRILDEIQLRDSYGNALRTEKAILPSFHIGNETLDNVSVGFFTGAIGRQRVSIIGGDILKRFNIIINAERTYIYLKSNNLKYLSYSTN